MSRSTVALIALAVGLAGTAGGYVYGIDQGAVQESAKRDSKAVADLTGLIDSHQQLISQSKAASAGMRKALGARAAADAVTTKDFQDALKATAGSRAGCVFDDGVMRQLAIARERSAKAAASGIRGALPSASGAVADR